MSTDQHLPVVASAAPRPAPHAAALSSPGPLQPSDLISYLQNTKLSCTQGYDVVSILAADRVNELFGQEYVTRMANNEAFAPVSARVPLVDDLYVRFSGVTLGQPLISFSPGGNPQDADLRIEFLSGLVTTEKTDNNLTTVMSTQRIQPGSGFVLTGVVPLADVQGEADQKTHEVRIDITNGSGFAAAMNIPGAAAHTTLGKYFLQLMQQNASSWAYTLGSLNYSAGGSTKLVPTSFEIDTQVDTANPDDKGRVLLYITTAYGTAPAGRPAGMPIQNMVPVGSTTTLIVSNQVLLGHMVLDVLRESMAQYHGSISSQPADPSIPGSLYAVTVGPGAAISFGPISYGLPQGPYRVTYCTGTRDPNNGINVLPADYAVPLSGLTVAAGGAGLNTTAQLQWNQQWAVEHLLLKNPLGSPQAVDGTIPMTVSLNGQQTAAIDAAGTISFSHPPTAVASFQEDSNVWDQIFKGTGAGAQIATVMEYNFQKPLQQMVQSLQLPEVQTFAVNNLLFPGNHNISFSSVYIPGDLVTFGDLKTPAIAVAPLYATLVPGQECKFSVSGPSVSGVRWGLGSGPAGQIGTDGTYTAPSDIDGTTHDVVTVSAMVGGTKQFSSAVVTIVPAGLTVSPDYVAMTPGAAPQQFVASMAGGTADISWSLVGPNALGTLKDGVFSPPASMTGNDMQAVTVRATSTADGSTADALVVVAPYPPQGAELSPSALAAPLSAGQSQQFTAKSATPVTKWSVLPATGGTITADGHYTAPQTVAAPTTVAVVAAIYPPFAMGVAPVQLAPGSPETGSD